MECGPSPGLWWCNTLRSSLTTNSRHRSAAGSRRPPRTLCNPHRPRAAGATLRHQGISKTRAQSVRIKRILVEPYILMARSYQEAPAGRKAKVRLDFRASIEQMFDMQRNKEGRVLGENLPRPDIPATGPPSSRRRTPLSGHPPARVSRDTPALSALPTMADATPIRAHNSA